MIQAGSVLIGKYPPGSGKDRRIIVVTHPNKDKDGRVAGVYLSTILADLTVVLEPGSHPLISQRCSVVFEEAFITQSSHIILGIERRLIELHPDLIDPQILEIILEGIYESAPAKVERFCTDRT
jgi:hypothetical protein